MKRWVLWVVFDGEGRVQLVRHGEGMVVDCRGERRSGRACLQDSEMSGRKPVVVKVVMSHENVAIGHGCVVICSRV